ncbi:hypothetical protein ACKGJN_02465 [Gillisia sp. Q332]|uniref:hypothetical protein n=1 Tax=Gillisia xinjiangensis TaxID=3384765 RepID=UPI00391B7C62
MKKKLHAELKDLATKILNNSEDNSTSFLKNQVLGLYEKLTVLDFTEKNLEAFSSNISSEEELNRKESKVEQVEVASKNETLDPPASVDNKQEEKDDYLPDGTQYNDSDALTEPNTEKIKDIVAQMPPETQNVDNLINTIISKNGLDKSTETPSKPKKDFRDIGVDYDNLPNFEPVKKQDKEERPRSLNDRLKNGINIGLNERLAFIRHLFDGKTADYNRVISQINTFDSVTEAKKFVQLLVKPDYKNWVGKEEYEQKFMELVENKFKS